MSEEQEEKDRGFKVADRRRFTAEGESRPDEGDEEASVVPPEARSEPQSAHGSSTTAEPPRMALDELTFSSFVIGLASQAFVFLGAAPDPQTGVVHKDLPQAKAMIDILSMLSEKTAGNLDEHEARMMEEMLYELRMQYVRDVRGGATTEDEAT